MYTFYELENKNFNKKKEYGNLSLLLIDLFNVNLGICQSLGESGGKLALVVPKECHYSYSFQHKKSIKYLLIDKSSTQVIGIII